MKRFLIAGSVFLSFLSCTIRENNATVRQQFPLPPGAVIPSDSAVLTIESAHGEPFQREGALPPDHEMTE